MKNSTAHVTVALTKRPSFERPLFLPQYVSATPAIVPSPADLPSWKRITIVIITLTIINNTDKTVFKVATTAPPNLYTCNK